MTWFFDSVTVRKWHIAEFHSAIFIAIKRPVVAGRNWPLADDQKTKICLFPKAALEKMTLNFQVLDVADVYSTASLARILFAVTAMD